MVGLGQAQTGQGAEEGGSGFGADSAVPRQARGVNRALVQPVEDAELQAGPQHGARRPGLVQVQELLWIDDRRRHRGGCHVVSLREKGGWVIRRTT